MCDGREASLPDPRGTFVKGREGARALNGVAIPNNVINCTEIEMQGGGQLS